MGAPARTASQVLSRKASIDGIQLDMAVNLNERLLENRPKREKKAAPITSISTDAFVRQQSRVKLGAQLKYCQSILRDFINSKKLAIMAWPFYEPVDWKVCVETENKAQYFDTERYL